jgi:poly-gamma-glutamate synthesis protein (capsule biosynthesis protein)
MASLTISMTGDIYPTRSLSPVPEHVGRVYAILRDSDIAIGNFEIPLSDRGAPVEKLLNIRADPAISENLSGLGLDVATLANNHAVDYGWAALEQTAALLRDKGIRVVGAGSDIAEAMRPEIIEAKGTRVGVIGFSCLLPTGMAAAASRPGIAPIHINTAYEIDPYYQMEEPGDISVVKVRTSAKADDLARAVSAVQNLKKRCDIVIVSLHWGFGSGEKLAEYQMPLAHSLIEAGADIIHGHHPHAVHAIGFHHGKPILFSMNVFIGQQVFLEASPTVKAMWAEMSADSYIARVSIQPDGTMEVEAIPTVLDANRLPILTEASDFERIHGRLARLSQDHGAVVERIGQTLHVRPAGKD